MQLLAHLCSSHTYITHTIASHMSQLCVVFRQTSHAKAADRILLVALLESLQFYYSRSQRRYLVRQSF